MGQVMCFGMNLIQNAKSTARDSDKHLVTVHFAQYLYSTLVWYSTTTAPIPIRLILLGRNSWADFQADSSSIASDWLLFKEYLFDWPRAPFSKLQFENHS